jgi:biopolymer transport protein TolQ
MPGEFFSSGVAHASGMLLIQSELLRLLWQAGPAAKIILLLLAGFSVLSWAVMWDRWKTFRAAESETDRFGELFRSTANLAQFRDQQGEFGATPLRALFRAGFQELSQSVPRKGETATPPQREVGMRNLDRALGRAQREENGRLERGLGFLATTASATPFIGLLGTVWGIMNAFQGIGLTGTANLAVVAPGIAEALINTAAGLGAAIPAVLGYNHFLGRLRRMSVRMENFSSEFAARADRILSLR